MPIPLASGAQKIEPLTPRAGRRAALLVCAGIGVVLAFLVLLYGYTGGSGMDGPCAIDKPFARSFDASTLVLRDHGTVVPLIGECRASTRDGRLLGTEAYPATRYRLYALVAFLLPFAVGGAYRRLRPRAPRTDAKP